MISEGENREREPTAVIDFYVVIMSSASMETNINRATGAI